MLGHVHRMDAEQPELSHDIGNGEAIEWKERKEANENDLDQHRGGPQFYRIELGHSGTVSQRPSIAEKLCYSVVLFAPHRIRKHVHYSECNLVTGFF